MFQCFEKVSIFISNELQSCMKKRQLKMNKKLHSESFIISRYYRYNVLDTSFIVVDVTIHRG